MTSIEQPALTSVRRSVTVAVTREHAFTVFTERFDGWWPRSHYNGTGEMARAVLESKPEGRWYAVGTDGSVNEWGKVLVWDPPSRLLLAWQLDSGYEYDPELVTEVEVVFTALEPHRTLVEIEHRNLDRYGGATNAMRDSFGGDGGWTGLLRSFGDLASDPVDLDESP
jgi:hypothetical protein